jgi:acetyl-CoA carboxylase biotin carboxylase subunit
MRGAAIECRVYAEDPYDNFMPRPGRINRLMNPAGPGVRLDSGIYEGWEVPLHYDPLLAKLCVWAETRNLAIARLSRALGEYVIEGIETSLPFFRAIVGDERFRRADFDTGFIDRHLGELMKSDGGEIDVRLIDIAAIAAVLHAKADKARHTASAPQSVESRWKMYGRMAQRK